MSKFYSAIILLLISQLSYASDGGGNGLGVVLLFVVLFVAGVYLYFLPAIMAGKFNHPDKTPIFILNLLLGWLLVPWVIALVWAYKTPANVVIQSAQKDADGLAARTQAATEPCSTFNAPKTARVDTSTPATKQCPFCAEEVKFAAIKCKHCQSDLPIVAVEPPPEVHAPRVLT